ncbi:hypothetical protein [Deinococcus maricopensis]|uniref:Uncharacterized protein n=1 Tax=Deinococcus maricopensis (strain DSM 21211 / LMG 22137 / NRRL B-23946 / LB-34) TaxID=709986 RepID=E8UBS8_DEIML|nr:hypothetical protein [Deinococcus maricopensis]ADV68517.1 hypothetical protein Deima_2888 [Deinococcus maricopensis DSM 21211]
MRTALTLTLAALLALPAAHAQATESAPRPVTVSEVNAFLSGLDTPEPTRRALNGDAAALRTELLARGYTWMRADTYRQPGDTQVYYHAKSNRTAYVIQADGVILKGAFGQPSILFRYE